MMMIPRRPPKSSSDPLLVVVPNKITAMVLSTITMVYMCLCLSTTTTSPTAVVTAFTTISSTTTNVMSKKTTTSCSRMMTTTTTQMDMQIIEGTTTNDDDDEAKMVKTVSSSTYDEQMSNLPVGSRVIRLPERGTRVRLFYPTTEEAAAAASDADYAPYHTDNRSSSSLLGKKSILSGCILNAPLATITTSEEQQQRAQQLLPPILVYSHDVGYNMDTSTFLFEKVASQNIIVAVVEHTDGTASPYTLRKDDDDGESSEKLRYLPNLMTERQQLARRASELLDAVEYIPKSDLFFGSDGATFSVRNVVIGGHGWGGPSAVMAANGASSSDDSSSPIDGIILHDPILGMGYGMLPPNKSTNKLSTITYTSDQYHYKKRVIYGTRTIHLKGCNHEHFVDTLVWRKKTLRIVPPGIVDPVHVHDELAGSMARFIHTCCNVDEGNIVGTNTKLFDVIR